MTAGWRCHPMSFPLHKWIGKTAPKCPQCGGLNLPGNTEGQSKLNPNNPKAFRASSDPASMILLGTERTVRSSLCHLGFCLLQPPAPSGTLDRAVCVFGWVWESWVKWSRRCHKTSIQHRVGSSFISMSHVCSALALVSFERMHAGLFKASWWFCSSSNCRNYAEELLAAAICLCFSVSSCSANRAYPLICIHVCRCLCDFSVHSLYISQKKPPF